MITSENQNFLDIFFEEAEDFLIKYPNNNRLKEIKIVKEKLSLEHAFFLLFSDYDKQVCNGGHRQYVGNGYHSIEQNGFIQNVSDNCDVHYEFVKLSKQFLEKYPNDVLREFIQIIEKFHIEIDNETEIEEICLECVGSGSDVENEDEDCYECDGSGEVMVDNSNRGDIDNQTSILFKELDDRYYKINDKLIAVIAIFIKNRKISESLKSF